jgi:magnesium transporter
MYGLTPKVEAAIRDSFASQQWRRLRMLMDPLHPADKADLLERISTDEIQILVSQYGNEFDPEILPYLDEEVREDVVEMLDPDVLAASLPELDSDDVVTIAEELEPEELDDALAALPARDRVLVEQSLSYPEDSAGRLMQREMVVVPPFWTVGQTIDYLRSTELDNNDFYLIMVTDTAGHPVGEVRLNKLLCAPRPRRISEIMDTDIRSLPVTMDQEEVALLFRRYGMVTTGVVDSEGRLAGIITLDDIIDVIDEEAEEDLMALAGVSDASIRTSVLETLRGRTPWLFVNLLTAIAASIVIGFFENTIEKVVALAVLMPIVASMGGNAGTQTITVAVRAIAMREFSPKLAVTFGLRELYVGVINGVLFASVTALLSYVWFGQADIALLLAIAMFINLIVASLSGTLIPLLLVKSGVDPAVASSVFITTITDVIGFLVFLGLAALYLI